MANLPEVWCHDCKTPHLATIPERTWACLHCSFASWAITSVPIHSRHFPAHIVQAKQHRTTAIRPAAARTLPA